MVTIFHYLSLLFSKCSVKIGLSYVLYEALGVIELSHWHFIYCNKNTDRLSSESTSIAYVTGLS